MVPDVTFADLDRRLVVVTTVTGWDEVPRIRHQVTRQLMRFYNVLFVELPFGSRSKRDRVSRIDDRLLIFRPARLRRGVGFLWSRVSLVHRLYNRRLALKIGELVGRLGYEQSSLVNFQYNFAQIMRSPVFGRKIYLCNDDFVAMAGSERQRKMLWQREREVASAADMCLCVSTPLTAKLHAVAESVELFLPGHEFPADVSDRRLPVDRSEDSIRVCFMGYVNARIQFAWLKALLQDEGFCLTLIGPVQEPDMLDDLRRFGNLRVLDPLEGIALQRAMLSHDVLIMPYDSERRSVRAATAPNKLFQYLACGKPVVISDMPAFLSLPHGFVYRASDAEGFISAVRRAFLEDSEELIRSRLEFAARNTWDMRGDRLRELLEPSRTESDFQHEVSTSPEARES